MDRERIWEIDLLRGIAVVFMIIFHVIFDLNDIYNYPIYYDRGFFYYLGKISVILFVLISGISCSFSKSNAKRGIKIFIIAMAITLITRLFYPELIIKFGILHLLSISMLIFPLFKPFNNCVLILIGTAIIFVGKWVATITVPYNFLFPIGLLNRNFFSADYYPILPWFGIFLFGVVAGRMFYSKKKSIFNFTASENILTFIGKNTLIIYIIHQPVILFIMSIVLKKYK